MVTFCSSLSLRKGRGPPDDNNFGWNVWTVKHGGGRRTKIENLLLCGAVALSCTVGIQIPY